MSKKGSRVAGTCIALIIMMERRPEVGKGGR